MECNSVRTFLSQINDRQVRLDPIPSSDLDYLANNGYLVMASKDDYDKEVAEVARLTQLMEQLNAERTEEQQADAALQGDERRERSITFRFEGKDKKDELEQRIKTETDTLAREQAQLNSLETTVNSLIQEKSTIDRMVAYDGGYVSLTGLGTLVLNDLNVRDYRVGEEEFADFVTEIKSVYAELRTIADRAGAYVSLIKPHIAEWEDYEYTSPGPADQIHDTIRAPSILWATAIGLAKLQGDTGQIGDRFLGAIEILQYRDSTLPNKLMASEIVTALRPQDVQDLVAAMEGVDNQLKGQGVPKELSIGIAATIMAGRRFDGTYPVDSFSRTRQLTKSFEAAAILAVINVPYDALEAKFQGFKALFSSWGYMTSEDTEIASAFLAIGELDATGVQVKLKYIIEQLKNYLEYPLVAAAILASIPVFEAHEVLDLMEKAVTLLTGYAAGLERSELVALAVRMIHGVRNEIVRKVDPTAKIASTPVQFTYAPNPGMFIWYHPVIIAHSYYHSTFSGMGGFHPAHSHGVGGFAG